MFQDEPDESDGPSLFQNEGEERHSHPLQDEPDEPDSAPLAPQAVGGRHLFGDESDEDDSGSEFLGYEADKEDGDRTSYQQVQLNFETMTKFLESQLHKVAGSSTQTSGKIVKKRRYNNENRAAKAAAAKSMRESACPTSTRTPRNSRDS